MTNGALDLGVSNIFLLNHKENQTFYAIKMLHFFFILIIPTLTTTSRATCALNWKKIYIYIYICFSDGSIWATNVMCGLPLVKFQVFLFAVFRCPDVLQNLWQLSLIIHYSLFCRDEKNQLDSNSTWSTGSPPNIRVPNKNLIKSSLMFSLTWTQISQSIFDILQEVFTKNMK